ncbi:hypothetical protein HDU99_009900, partial [Rhizoclosmatium hyalinum]
MAVVVRARRFLVKGVSVSHLVPEKRFVVDFEGNVEFRDEGDDGDWEDLPETDIEPEYKFEGGFLDQLVEASRDVEMLDECSDRERE